MEADIKLDSFPNGVHKILPPRLLRESAMGREEGNHDWYFQRAPCVNTRSLATNLAS